MMGSAARSAAAWRSVCVAWTAGRRREVERAGGRTAPIEVVASTLTIASRRRTPFRGLIGPAKVPLRPSRAGIPGRYRRRHQRRKFTARLRWALGEKRRIGSVLASAPNGGLSLSPNRVEIFRNADQNSAAAIKAGHRSRRTTCRLAMTSSLRRRQVSLERRGFFQVSTEARLWPRPGAIRRDGLSGPFRRSAL